MSISGNYLAGPKYLVFTADNDDNPITIGRNVAGLLFANGGGIPILGGVATVANTSLIQVFGNGGNDVVTLDESNGALPAAKLFGGMGNDVLTGGSGADQLFGQDDHDILLGRGGVDLLFGGAGNDTLTGGDADDQLFGEAGDDRMIWNPGDDTDLHEGGTGIDTSEVNGGNGAEVFTATANGARVRFDRINPAPFLIDIGTTEKLVVNMNGGNDTFSATGNLAALIGITVDGGSGDDTILGSNGADLLLGGANNDFVDGQQGNDTAFLGSGDDVFQWDPGDGSDIVEGEDGSDEMLFNGSAANEIFAVTANGGRVLFTRNVGAITMDLDGIETITLNAVGGTDSVTVNDLTGTDATQVAVNLASTIGGAAGDGQADTVIANATSGANIIDITGAGTSYAVTGLAAQISVANSEGANDQLVVNGLGGNDTITATTLPGGVTGLTLDGGTGDDSLLGSQGADTIFGGDGNDFVSGDNGNDVAFLGADNDVFQWNPSDGSDTIEGQGGADSMVFFGSNAAENITIQANGGRALFLRDVAAVTMDLNDVETIDFRALGGTDAIVVGDLFGTDVTEVAIDLRGPVGGGDGAVDMVTASGTGAADGITVTGDAGGVIVTGLQAQIIIGGQEAANDRLTVNGLGGDDVINASSLEADGIQLTLNGGLGVDLLIGSEGGDLINGGDGNDIALMGAGDDIFVWNPGDDNDTLEGQAGFDTMLFNGANIGETIAIAANGGRVLFTRNVANVVMDLNDTESIDFNALGGADAITINDLGGTDITEINLNLASAIGGTAGDGAADTVTIDATNGDDVIVVVGDNGSVQVLGLSAVVNITGFEATLDRLIINGLNGDDVVDASGLGASSIQLTVDGGADDDIIIGGSGNDVLSGGPGDDVIIGGPGVDVIDGGLGDDVEIQRVASPDMGVTDVSPLIAWP